MHVEQAQRLPALQDEAGELLRVVSRFRWRLGCERTLLFGLRGAIASGMALIGLSVAAWLAGVHSAVWPAALPTLAGLGLGLARWPSHKQAALAADRRLALDERLGTAVELIRRPRIGRFDALQVRDAVDRARSASASWLSPEGQVRREALLTTGAIALAAASLLLSRIPPPQSPLAAETTIPPDAAAADGVAERGVPPEVQDIPLADAQPVQQAQTDADLAARVQQEQSERAALDTLSQALRSVSAGQAAADAIQQGDFPGARNDLQTLGEEADQLSEAAKQQLSRALQEAAAGSAQADRQLADRERQAAQALSRPTYNDQRQALRGLGDQVERSGARSVSADQLARDVGRLQQQTASRQGPGAASQAPASGLQGSPGAAGQAAQQPGPAAGGQGSGAAGQQGGPGAGTGTDADLFSDQPSRLDTAGQSVKVPTRLGSGAGVRPPDGTEDQTASDASLGARSVSELAQAQQTGQVAPEQNLVPGEQRPVVRGYFR